MATSPWQNFDDMFSRFDRVPECDGQTDGRNYYIDVALFIALIADV